MFARIELVGCGLCVELVLFGDRYRIAFLEFQFGRFVDFFRSFLACLDEIDRVVDDQSFISFCRYIERKLKRIAHCDFRLGQPNRTALDFWGSVEAEQR